MKLHPEILSEKQRQLLEQLGFLKERGIYLAGGTALALQLGHRTSLDFDFYSRQKFDNKNLAEGFGIKEVKPQPEDTFQAVIEGVSVSVFFYPYELVSGLIEFGLTELAGLEDIAAMKVAAVIQRGKQRDFVDIYYLTQKLSMIGIIEAALKKYPWYKENKQMLFKALTYFADADADTEVGRIKVLDSDFSWEAAKRKIYDQVRMIDKS